MATTCTSNPVQLIGDDVVIGDRVTIHSGVESWPAAISRDDVTIFPNAVLYEDTIVGPRSIIHAGVVIGAYGFGYKFVDGRHQLSHQLGYVEIGADVEIGANSTIDRGTYSATVIGDGTKIDNLVMIAHNCRIGRHNMICSQVGIAGSTTTGDYVVMAGQVGVRDHVHIGTGAILGAMAGVANDVPDGAHMLGAPAVPEREQKLMFATMAKLPEMRKAAQSSCSGKWMTLAGGRKRRRPCRSVTAASGGQSPPMRLRVECGNGECGMSVGMSRQSTPSQVLIRWRVSASVSSPVGVAIRSSSPRRSSAAATKCTAWA